MEYKEFENSLFLEFLMEAKKLRIAEAQGDYIKLIGTDLDEPITFHNGREKIPADIFKSILKKTNSSEGEFCQWLSINF
jgi:hypothetical protein